jgi:GAF domain-containing protein
MANQSNDAAAAETMIERLGDIARQLAEARDLDEVLQMIVDLGEAHLDGCDGVSLMLIGQNRRISSPAFSSRVAYDSDQAQYETDEGPCLDALREHETVVIDDLETERRWPDYTARALGLGIRSMISFRLFVQEDTMGALDFYSAAPHAYDRHSKVVGQVFASLAGVALKAAITEAGLDATIRTRDVIGQAKGIMMERHTVSAGEAFDRLRTISQGLNRPLREVALDIATTGEIPRLGA